MVTVVGPTIPTEGFHWPLLGRKPLENITRILRPDLATLVANGFHNKIYDITQNTKSQSKATMSSATMPTLSLPERSFLGKLKGRHIDELSHRIQVMNLSNGCLGNSSKFYHQGIFKECCSMLNSLLLYSNVNPCSSSYAHTSMQKLPYSYFFGCISMLKFPYSYSFVQFP